MTTTKNFEQVILSDKNRTPIVQVITWLALVSATLAFLTHVAIKVYICRALRLESWFVLGSLIFCAAQSTTVINQTQNGFGKPMKTLSESDIQANFKNEYAGMVLFILSVGCSKLAVISFIHNLTPSRTHQSINYSIGLISTLWLVGSGIVAACQCSLPHPWNRLSGQCIDRLTWWDAVSILNMVTEVAIVALKLGITGQLQTALRRKAGIMSLFACRLLVPIISLAQLVLYHEENRDTALKEDLTLGYWRSATCNQLVQCFAILTTCLPYTKFFMEGFDSGLMRFDDMRRRGEHVGKDKGSGYQLMDISRSTQAQQINVSKSWNIRSEPAKELSAT